MLSADKHISSCQHFGEISVFIREIKKVVLWLNLNRWLFYALTKRRLTLYTSRHGKCS
jgi:hypothetical protein